MPAQPRIATPADAEELTRLRGVMLATLGVDISGAAWQAACVADLRERLLDHENAVAFVVDADGGGGLAASGIGLVRHMLPGPTQVDGRTGYVLSVCTDEEFRGRGYATAIMSSLLSWFTSRSVRRVDLHASPFGVGIYRRLGFRDLPHPELTWSPR